MSQQNIQFANNIVSQIVSSDLYSFTIDNRFKFLSKTEYSGQVITTRRFPSNSVFNHHSLHYSQDEEIILYSASNPGILYRINPNTLTIPPQEFSTRVVQLTGALGNNITLDIYGNIIRGRWDEIIIDNNNNLYTIETLSISNEPLVDIGFDSSVAVTSLPSGSRRVIRKYVGPSSKIVDPFNPNTLGNVLLLSDLQNETLLFETQDGDQFDILFRNSDRDAITTKPFNPRRLLVDRENKLYIFNDTKEYIIIDLNSTPLKMIEWGVLFDGQKRTGISLSKWNQIQDTTLIGVALTIERNPFTKNVEEFFWIQDNENRTLIKTNNKFQIVECFSLFDAIDKVVHSDENTNNYQFPLNPSTAYDWYRKYVWIPTGKKDNVIEANIYTDSNSSITKSKLLFSDYPISNKNWYHVALTYNQEIGEAKLYVDGIESDRVHVDPGSSIFNLYDNGVSIGADLLRNNTINEELNCDAYGFDGKLYDIRSYNKTLTPNQIGQIILSSKNIEDINWNLPIKIRQFVEKIEGYFRHRPPGSHSQFYNIRLSGLGITDPDLKSQIEIIIRQAVNKISPAHTSLLNIIWQ